MNESPPGAAKHRPAAERSASIEKRPLEASLQANVDVEACELGRTHATQRRFDGAGHTASISKR